MRLTLSKKMILAQLTKTNRLVLNSFLFGFLKLKEKFFRDPNILLMYRNLYLER
jgi:hypothetical protein